MKLKDLYEHKPEQIITAKKAYVKHIIRKEKITPPKWMARNWKFTGDRIFGFKFLLTDNTYTKLPEYVSSANIYYYYSNDKNSYFSSPNRVKIKLQMGSLTSFLYKKTVLQIYVPAVYQEVFGKNFKECKDPHFRESIFIDDPDLLTPELENAIQTKKLNIMDPVTFHALHEIAKDQDAIK
jgi:hypothetical protein